MGEHYSQLDLDERIELARLKQAGKSNRECGRIMGRHRSSIDRELRRNDLPKAGYKPAAADRMAFVRCQRVSKIERLGQLETHVVDRLAMGWSPEQIAGRLRLEQAEHNISHESIYRFIYRPKVRVQKLYRYLPRAKSKRGRRYFKRRRDPIEARFSIKNRPQHIEKREEFGHWEGDYMIFRILKGGLLTLTERKTRLTLTQAMTAKTAAETAKAIIDQLKNLPKMARRSITFDQGKEFSRNTTLEQELGISVWYCEPHSPWQRGSIENTNGIIRRDMPRKMRLTDYSPADIENIAHLMNATPRKVLGFHTPAEVFMENLQIAF